MVIQILGLLFIGLVIGALARLIKPGRQRLSIGMTLVLGWVGQLLWAVYGALASDLGVLVCSTVALVMQTAIVRARFRRTAVLVAEDYELAA